MSNSATAKLVRSVVAERGLVPVMNHFHLYNGRMQGTDGKLTLDAPWSDYTGDDINVPAAPFVKAFESMDDPEISIKGDFMTVKQGKMRVRIPLSKDDFPRAARPTDWEPCDNSFLQACARIRPFIGNDNARLWACGVLYRDGWLYATNNVSLVRTRWQCSWIDTDFTLPSFAIDQLQRTQRPISAIHIRDNAIGFELEGDVWLESNRYVEPWPDVHTMIPDMSDLPTVPADLAAAVEKVLPFCPDSRFPVIRLTGDKVATMEGDMQAELEMECGEAAFHAHTLRVVLATATGMDFGCYPKPVPFCNEDGSVQGVAMGVRT